MRPMTDDVRADWLADLYVEPHGIEGAIDELQDIYGDSYDERADRALVVLKEIRQRKEVEA